MMWLTFEKFVAFWMLPALLCSLHVHFVLADGDVLYEGSPCKLKSGDSGVCTRLSQCKSIYDGIMRHTFPYSDLVNCGFVGKESVVCCGDRKPTEVETTTEFIFGDPDAVTTQKSSSPDLDGEWISRPPSTDQVSSNLVDLHTHSNPHTSTSRRESSSSSEESGERRRGNRVEFNDFNDFENTSSRRRRPTNTPSTTRRTSWENPWEPFAFRTTTMETVDFDEWRRVPSTPRQRGRDNSLEAIETDNNWRWRQTTARTTSTSTPPSSASSFIFSTLTTTTPSSSSAPILDDWMIDALLSYSTSTSTARNTVLDRPVAEQLNLWPASESSGSQTSPPTTRCPDCRPTQRVSADDDERPAQRACRRYTKGLAPALDFHILDGVPVQPGEFPHMAAIGYGSISGDGIEWNCGGSLISERYVLTAAHCFRYSRPVLIRLGIVLLNRPQPDASPIDVGVQDVIIHPQYKSPQTYHDIALIRLNTSLDSLFSDRLRPACLSTDLGYPSRRANLTVSGWGVTNVDTNAKSDILLKADLSIVDIRSCNQTLASSISRQLPRGLENGQMCAFDPEMRRDSCSGDSGGPLQATDTNLRNSTIIGITSFGISCGTATPGVYSKVSNYVDWIEPIVWPE